MPIDIEKKDWYRQPSTLINDACFVYTKGGNISMLDTIIIGAGQAGLSMGYSLKQKDISFLLLDAGARVGDSWRKRYKSLVLFSPKLYSALPGMQIKGDQNAFPTKDEIADYLEAYAEHFSLPVQLHTHVQKVKRANSGFEVVTNKGTLYSKQVVVAPGAFQSPFIPSMSNGYPEDVFQIHSSEYIVPSQIPEGPVLVVGGGNSGAQIATELAADREVSIAISRPFKFLPLQLLGKSTFSWLEILGFLYAETDTKRGNWFRKQGDRIFGFEFRNLIQNGRVQVKPRALDVQGDRTVFQDGSSMVVKNIIWSTGFVPGYKWLEITGALDETGRPLHYKGVSPVEGLFFIGLPWQRQRGSALVCGVGRDAEYLLPFLSKS